MSGTTYGVCASCGGRRTVRPERVSNLCRSCYTTRHRKIASETWMAASACNDQQYHPEWWTGAGEFHELATHICRTACRVRETCLSWAIANDERDHVYGGLTPQDRARLAREFGHLLTEKGWDYSAVTA